MKIATVGKGGSGKTTIAGTLARVYADEERSILAIDGDPNPNLALTLGMTRSAADAPNARSRRCYWQGRERHLPRRAVRL